MPLIRQEKESMHMDRLVNQGTMRTAVLFIIIVPVVAYLLYFAYQKNTQSQEKADQCQDQCSEQGAAGYEFKWSIFSGPQCACLESE